jgi:hypothetical protein
VKIFQYWMYGNTIPEVYKRCIESLNKFSIENNWEHILYLDEDIPYDPVGKYTIRRDNSLKELHASLKYIPVSSKIDYKRYFHSVIESKNSNVCFIDADIYFFRNPRKYLEVTNKTRFYKGSAVWNGAVCGVFGYKQGEPIGKFILSKATDVLNDLTGPTSNQLIIGPNWLNDRINEYGGYEPYDLVGHEWMCKYGWPLCQQICAGESWDFEGRARKMVEDPRSVSHHLFKTFPKKNKARDEANLLKWIDTLDLENAKLRERTSQNVIA